MHTNKQQKKNLVLFASLIINAMSIYAQKAFKWWNDGKYEFL